MVKYLSIVAIDGGKVIEIDSLFQSNTGLIHYSDH